MCQTVYVSKHITHIEVLDNILLHQLRKKCIDTRKVFYCSILYFTKELGGEVKISKIGNTARVDIIKSSYLFVPLGFS